LTLRAFLRQLKISALAVWVGARDPEVSLAARVFGLCVAAYAFSPIDLIPDFIPVLGLLDDVILVPLGVWMFIKMVGPKRHALHLAKAAVLAKKPVSKVGAFTVVSIWAICALALVWTIRR
jgi:uncharacterized membrane protein YkvA (DUF1232 family)